MKGFQKGDLNPAKSPEFREFIRQVHLEKSPWNKGPSQYETVRQNHFLKYGWKCRVVWEDELEHEDKLFERFKETV